MGGVRVETWTEPAGGTEVLGVKVEYEGRENLPKLEAQHVSHDDIEFNYSFYWELDVLGYSGIRDRLQKLLEEDDSVVLENELSRTGRNRIKIDGVEKAAISFGEDGYWIFSNRIPTDLISFHYRELLETEGDEINEMLEGVQAGFQKRDRDA